jgi:hypothetical protein
MKRWCGEARTEVTGAQKTFITAYAASPSGNKGVPTRYYRILCHKKGTPYYSNYSDLFRSTTGSSHHMRGYAGLILAQGSFSTSQILLQSLQIPDPSPFLSILLYSFRECRVD